MAERASQLIDPSKNLGTCNFWPKIPLYWSATGWTGTNRHPPLNSPCTGQQYPKIFRQKFSPPLPSNFRKKVAYLGLKGRSWCCCSNMIRLLVLCRISNCCPKACKLGTSLASRAWAAAFLNSSMRWSIRRSSSWTRSSRSYKINYFWEMTWSFFYIQSLRSVSNYLSISALSPHRNCSLAIHKRVTYFFFREINPTH